MVWHLKLAVSILLFASYCSPKPPEPPAETPPPEITRHADGKLIKRSGWLIPDLPDDRTFKQSMRGEIPILTSYSDMHLVRFTEPFDAMGSHGWGRLMSVTEFASMNKKPFCYRLAAETDWEKQNQRVGALIIAWLSDNDGDGIFETLGGEGCPVPDWAK